VKFAIAEGLPYFQRQFVQHLVARVGLRWGLEEDSRDDLPLQGGVLSRLRRCDPHEEQAGHARNQNRPGAHRRARSTVASDC
jgi:hypothetical protein